MPFYENVLIARQDLSAAQSEALVQKFSDVIKENGGKVSKTEYWGLRQLAYKVKKNRKGHYHLLNIDAPAASIVEMERQMRLNEDILRFQTVRVEKLEEGPSIQMRRSDRDDNGFGRDREGFGGDRDRPRDGYRNRHSAATSDNAAASEDTSPSDVDNS